MLNPFWSHKRFCPSVKMFSCEVLKKTKTKMMMMRVSAGMLLAVVFHWRKHRVGRKIKAPECLWAEQRPQFPSWWGFVRGFAEASLGRLSSTSRCRPQVCRCAAPPSPSSPAASPASPEPCAAPSASSWRSTGRSGSKRPAPEGRDAQNLVGRKLMKQTDGNQVKLDMLRLHFQ